MYSSIDVDSYFDCGVSVGNYLFWGERLGKISGYDMYTRQICFNSFINHEAEMLYKDKTAVCPSFPVKSSDYMFLPEIHLANYIASQLCITALAVYDHYLVAGDMSGRVSIFDIRTLSITMTFSVGGAVSGIKFVGKHMLINYAEARNLDSPAALRRHKEVVQLKCRLKPKHFLAVCRKLI